MKSSLQLLQAWLRSQCRWLYYHAAQEGVLFLCFVGIVGLWMFMLQDIIHTKIGVLSPVIYGRITDGALYLTFGLHALFLRQSTQYLQSTIWWEFHTRMGGAPSSSQWAKGIMLTLLYGITTLFVVSISSRLFGSKPAFHWALFSVGSILAGYSLAAWSRRPPVFSLAPPRIPSSQLGALVWGLLRPIFLPHGSRKASVFFLLATGNGYLAYSHFPDFVCVLYTFLLALLPVGSLTQQLSRNLAYHGLETQHGISESTYLEALYLCTGGLGLIGGVICSLSWSIGLGAAGEYGSFWIATVLIGVYLSPLWVLSTCWLQLDPHRPTLPFLTALLGGIFFASAIYATPWAWVGFPLLYRYGTLSQMGRRVK